MAQQNYFSPPATARVTPQNTDDPGGAGGGGMTTPDTGNSLLNFLNSPGGAAAGNALGQGLQAYGSAQTANANRQQTAQQFAATMVANQFNADRSFNAQTAAGVLSADPLGAEQKYAQHNALMNAILPNLRNAHSTPGDPAVAAAMGNRTGGIMNLLPEGGLDPNMVNSMYGPASTMAAIAQRQKQLTNLDSSAPVTDLTSLYGQQAAGAQQQQIQQWATQLQGKQGADKQAFEQQLQGYIDQMVKQESNTGGFWHKFAKIAGIVGAGVATVMTAGGATPLLVAAVGAGAGAANAWGSGGNPLLGAITGGGSSYMGARLNGNGAADE